MLKSLSILEKMHFEDTNKFTSNIIGKYENRPDDLHLLCLADLASNYVSKKSGDVPVESNDINKSYTIPVSNIDDIGSIPSTNALKNKRVEMQKRNRPCVIRFQQVSRFKNPEEHYLQLLQLYMPWRNESELKQDDKSYENRYKEFKMILCANMKLIWI